MFFPDWKHLDPTKESQEFAALVGRLTSWGKDSQNRAIVIQPLLGNYGEPNAVFVSVCGSPPRGQVYLDITFSGSRAVILSGGMRGPRLLNEAQTKTVLAFLERTVPQGDGHKDLKSRICKPYVVMTSPEVALPILS
jgi:hypothetical protein